MSSEAMKSQVIGSVPMRVSVQGRVLKSRLNEGIRYTSVITPAPDLYSRPSVVEIRSKSPIGAVEEDVTVWCVLSGYAERPRRWTDKNTGEVKTFQDVRMFLNLVE